MLLRWLGRYRESSEGGEEVPMVRRYGNQVWKPGYGEHVLLVRRYGFGADGKRRWSFDDHFGNSWKVVGSIV